MRSNVKISSSKQSAAPSAASAGDPFVARLSRALVRAKRDATHEARERLVSVSEELRRSFAGRVQSQIEHPIFASTDETWCVDSAGA